MRNVHLSHGDLKNPNWIIWISLVLGKSLPPLMGDIPNTTKLELEELKWREIGLESSLLHMYSLSAYRQR